MNSTNTQNTNFSLLVKKILKIFYNKNKISFYKLFAFVFLSSVFDVISFTLIIPVIYLLNDPNPIFNNSILHFFYKNLHFTSIQNFIFFLLFVIVIVFILKNLFLLFTSYKQNKFAYAVAGKIVQHQLNRFYKNDYLDIRTKNSIEYLRCLVEAPEGFADYLMIPLIYILNESLVVFFIIIGLFLFKPIIVLLILVTILPISFILLKFAKNKLQNISELKGKLEKDSYLESIEGINGYTDIKLFNKETYYVDYIYNKYKILYDMNASKNLYLVIPRRIIEVIIILIIFILYGIAQFIFSISDKELVFILIAFATAAYRLLPSFNEILTNIVKIRTSEFIFDLINILKDPIAVEYSSMSFQNSIELKDLCYSYPSNKEIVLKNLNLFINKGEFVVLTGASGSGKTTIGKILTGFIKPTSGNIYIDKQELQHINQIKNKIGYVTQDFYLFDKTIIENIAIGEDINSIDQIKINKILNDVNLLSFIEQQQFGLMQPIGEMGNKMSGGEKQRLAIARAMYKNAEILVLDEATSSLDVSNELEVLDTIYKIAKSNNITVLIITHRISTVKKYDKLYYLQDRKLKEA